jgi:hypothetical protein
VLRGKPTGGPQPLQQHTMLTTCELRTMAVELRMMAALGARAMSSALARGGGWPAPCGCAPPGSPGCVAAASTAGTLLGALSPSCDSKPGNPGTAMSPLVQPSSLVMQGHLCSVQVAYELATATAPVRPGEGLPAAVCLPASRLHCRSGCLCACLSVGLSVCLSDTLSVCQHLGSTAPAAVCVPV